MLHKQPFTLICLKENELICSDCALFGHHWDHEVIKLDLYKETIQKIKEKVSEYLKKIDADKQLDVKTQER